MLLALTGCVGLIAGSYLLSQVTTVEIFKDRLKIGGKNLLTRSLVVIQFCLSISLIVSTIIMNRQQDFMTNRNLGYDKDHVVVVPTQISNANKEEGERILRFFKNELSAQRDVIHVTGSSNSFGISFQVFKAAINNPVETLRYE